MDLLLLVSLALLILGAATQEVAVSINVATSLLVYRPLLFLAGIAGLVLTELLALVRTGV